MLKSLVMKRKIVLIFVIGGLLFIGKFVIGHKNLIKNILRIWEANTIEPNPSEKVYAVFSFQTGVFTPVHTSFPHFIVKLTDISSWKIKNETISGIADILDGGYVVQKVSLV